MSAGRPTKRETFINQSVFADELDLALRDSYARVDDRHGLPAVMGVSARMKHLDEALLQLYTDNAKSLRPGALKAVNDSPWASQLDASQVGKKLLHQRIICMRIIESLKKHLVEQVIILESIDNRIGEVSDSIRGKFDTPSGFESFVEGLHASGLKVHAVRRLTPEQMGGIADALNSGDLSMFGAPKASKYVPMTDSESDILASTTKLKVGVQDASIPVLEASPVFTNASPPPVEDAEWKGPGAPTPAFFDGLNATGMKLRWQLRDALKSEGSTVIGMPWPTVDSWPKLVMIDQIISEDMDTTDYDLEGISLLLNAHISLISRISEDDVPVN